MAPEINEKNSIEDLLADVKLYVADPKYRIQLDELVLEETRKLTEKMTGDGFNVYGQWDASVFSTQVEYCECATKRLALTLGILGRWGESPEEDHAVNVLLHTYRALSDDISGYSVWINLRIYSVVLLLVAYGLALTHSNRWSTIRNLLNIRITDRNEEPIRIVENLNLSSWHTIDESVWRTLDGLRDRRTPISDHVCDLMATWNSGILGVVPDFEELFDLWDVLASLIYAESFFDGTSHEGTSRDEMINWIPLGRARWRAPARLQILYRLRNDLSTDLLNAGFFSGNRETLYRAIDYISTSADRRMWN